MYLSIAEVCFTLYSMELTYTVSIYKLGNSEIVK